MESMDCREDGAVNRRLELGGIQKGQQISLHVSWRDSRMVPLHRIPAYHDVLDKIPRKLLVVRVRLEELVHRMRIGPIDVDLQERKLHHEQGEQEKV